MGEDLSQGVGDIMALPLATFVGHETSKLHTRPWSASAYASNSRLSSNALYPLNYPHYLRLPLDNVGEKLVALSATRRGSRSAHPRRRFAAQQVPCRHHLGDLGRYRRILTRGSSEFRVIGPREPPTEEKLRRLLAFAVCSVITR